MVCQLRCQVESDSSQGGMAALSLIFGDVLRCGPTGFANKLGQTSLVNAMATCSIETDRADMLQALNQTEHRDRFPRLRHLA